MTLEWWDDLWLNEGFASYLEYRGASSYETEWDTYSLFLTRDLHGVMDLDATLGSHPIVVNVTTPDEVSLEILWKQVFFFWNFINCTASSFPNMYKFQ